MSGEHWRYATFETPLGACTVAGPTGRLGLCHLGDGSDEIERLHLTAGRQDAARRQIDAYFAGALREFSVPLDWSLVHGFQLAVLQALMTVPYGRTIAYGELAAKAGSPRAARAVGGAVGRNPLSIVVPCHRVLAARGAIGGYGYGLAAKRALLAIEGVRDFAPATRGGGPAAG